MTRPAPPATIHLADQRRLTEAAEFRRWSTFGPGVLPRPSFGALHGCHEEWLAGAQCTHLAAEHAAVVLVLPITGAVEVRVPAAALSVGVEEVACVPVPAGAALQFCNPYPADTVHFLHLWLPAPQPAPAQQLAFRTADLDNRLMPLLPAALPAQLWLGRFGGRAEAVHRPQQLASRVFVFVLAGAFEVEGRLLHEKDGLALWDAKEIELEALSNNALVLLLELPPSA